MMCMKIKPYSLLVSLLVAGCSFMNDGSAKKTPSNLIATPASYYSTAKARYLGAKYKDNLDRLTERIVRNPNTAQLQFANNISSVGGIGFFTHSATKTADERYLEVVLATPETFDSKGEYSEKVNRLFSRYGQDLLAILSGDNEIFQDKELAGYGLNLNWRTVIAEAKENRVSMARAIVYFQKDRVASFIRRNISQNELLGDAVIFAVEDEGPLQLVSYQARESTPDFRPAIREDNLAAGSPASKAMPGIDVGGTKPEAKVAPVKREEPVALMPRESSARPSPTAQAKQPSPVNQSGAASKPSENRPAKSAEPVQSKPAPKADKLAIPTPPVEAASIIPVPEVVLAAPTVAVTKPNEPPPAQPKPDVLQTASQTRANTETVRSTVESAKQPIVADSAVKVSERKADDGLLTAPKTKSSIDLNRLAKSAAVAEPAKSQGLKSAETTLAPVGKTSSMPPPATEKKVLTSAPSSVEPEMRKLAVSPALSAEAPRATEPVAPTPRVDPNSPIKPVPFETATSSADRAEIPSFAPSAAPARPTDEVTKLAEKPPQQSQRVPMSFETVVPKSAPQNEAEAQPAATSEPVIAAAPMSEIKLKETVAKPLPAKTPTRVDVKEMEPAAVPTSTQVKFEEAVPASTGQAKSATPLAGEQLALLRKPAEPSAAQPALARPAPKPLQGFIIQVAFNDKQKAQNWAEKMTQRGYAVSVTETGPEGSLRVRLGNFAVRDDAERQLQSFKHDGMTGIIINLPQAFRPEARSSLP